MDRNEEILAAAIVRIVALEEELELTTKLLRTSRESVGVLKESVAVLRQTNDVLREHIAILEGELETP
jgi:hypothetical protein